MANDDHALDALQYSRHSRGGLVGGPSPGNSAGGTDSLSIRARKARPIVADAGESEEAAAQAIGQYMSNFVSYGLSPKVRHVPGGWRVKLTEFGPRGDMAASAFKITVSHPILQTALRHADAAAGTWFTQRALEKSVEKDSKSKSGVALDFVDFDAVQAASKIMAENANRAIMNDALMKYVSEGITSSRILKAHEPFVFPPAVSSSEPEP